MRPYRCWALRGFEWCSLEAALNRVSVVGDFSRFNLKVSHISHNQVTVADDNVRLELAKIAQNRPGISPTAIIDISSQRHSIWPLTREFTKTSAYKGAGKGMKGMDWSENYRPSAEKKHVGQIGRG